MLVGQCPLLRYFFELAPFRTLLAYLGSTFTPVYTLYILYVLYSV